MSAILIVSITYLLYSVLGPLPSALIFLLTQLYVISGTLFIGTLNVSALLQVSFITNQGWVDLIADKIVTSLLYPLHSIRWISDMAEEKVLLSAKIGILLHNLLNVYENVMVKCKWIKNIEKKSRCFDF